MLGGFWSSYYYNGFIYGSEFQRGLRRLQGDGQRVLRARTRKKVRTLNAQTQG